MRSVELHEPAHPILLSMRSTKSLRNVIERSWDSTRQVATKAIGGRSGGAPIVVEVVVVVRRVVVVDVGAIVDVVGTGNVVVVVGGIVVLDVVPVPIIA